MSNITANNMVEYSGTLAAGQRVVLHDGKWLVVGTGSAESYGMIISEVSGTTITVKPNSVVKHTLSANETLTFDVSKLTANQCVTMELWLTMPETAVSFTLSEVTWIDEPDFSAGNTLYAVVIRWDGQKLIGNVAYTLEVS